MKESFATTEPMGTIFQKSSPFEKLIASDHLTYLPNLYFRKYKLIEGLSQFRQDFPDQKIMLRRNSTNWDVLLTEMRNKSKALIEIRKYRLAQRAHVARAARAEAVRSQMRKEERYFYHRLLSSSLSNSVCESYRQQLPAQPEIKPEPMEIEEKQPEKPPIRADDEIFIADREESWVFPIENNLIDDLLNEPQHIDYAQPQDQTPVIGHIADYKSKMYRLSKELIDSPPCKISRKGVLSRILANARHRQKYREQGEEQEANLSSATVLLSGMISSEEKSEVRDKQESKEYQFVQLPSRTEWMVAGESGRRRKKAEDWELRWEEEEMNKVDEINGFRKGKMDGSVLTLKIPQDEEEYKRQFEKSIAGNKSFPPTLWNIEQFEQQDEPHYYNEFYDKSYEKFVMDNSKKELLQTFAKNSPFLFPESCSHEDLDESSQINVARMFVYPPEKICNKLIYRLTDYKLSAVIREDDKFSLPLDGDRLALLAYLVEKYLKQFGNNWKLITQFIQINPCFSNVRITTEAIQEIYQLVQRHQNSSSNFNNSDLWDKKILPYDTYGCESYIEFKPELFPKIIPSCVTATRTHQEESEDFDLSTYAQSINEPLEESDEFDSLQLGNQFRKFTQNLADSSLAGIRSQSNEAEELKKVLNKFVSRRPTNQIKETTLLHRENEWVFEYVSNHLKGEIKSGMPSRKKKKITENNNELVRLLQALRAKTNNIPTQMPQKKMDESTPKAVVPPSKVTFLPPAPVLPKIEIKEEKKAIPILKTPENKLGGGFNKKKKSKNSDDKN